MKLSIAPHDLPKALALGPPALEVLSLDCFDTLIWRNTHAPRDVFTDLEATSCSPIQRVLAEDHARRRAELAGRDEVTIEEIYRCLAPNADEATRARLIDVELEAEARHCFAFRPTVELMQQAKATGLKVIIVSDTYLSEIQLRTLIQRAAGDEVLGLIDEVFCSSVYGRPKTGGLFKDVLKALKVDPGRILHLGDNEAADRTAALRHGLNAVHLEQFDAPTQQRLRLEATVSRLVCGSADVGQPVLQPHRAQLAMDAERNDPTSLLGYAVLGPVLDTYVRWLRVEAQDLEKARGGQVHLLFLMRDGYLPMRAYEASVSGGPLSGAAVEISRYTAQAAAFDSDEAVLAHVERQLNVQAPEYIGKQMLLSEAETAELLGAGPDQKRRTRFHAEIRRPRNLDKIKTRSAAFASRLVDYVRRTVQPAPGDTLMLVDLGYNGSVQNAIAGLLSRELEVHVAGRYLLLAETEVSGLDKRGLLDPRNYDSTALHALSAYVAVIEQICTVSQGSVVDYGPDGPVRRENDIKANQSAIRDQIQAAVLLYVATAGTAILRPALSTDEACARRAAAATLARLLFLPMPEELEVLRSFQHDVNLGSQETLALFDGALAEEGLRQRGMFYVNNSRRMYLSAELRGQGLPLSLTLLAQSRFGLDLRYKDFCDSAIQVPIMVAHGKEVVLETATANPTHGGYYLLDVPIADCRYAIGVQFGQIFEAVQLEAVHFAKARELLESEPNEVSIVTPAAPVFEGASGGRGGVIDFEEETGFMLVPPPARVDDTPMVLAVVFRPISWRARAEARLEAASIAAE